MSTELCALWRNLAQCCISDRLPYSIRVLLESAVRNCDQFQVRPSDVTNILEWEQNQGSSVEIPFHPARVILQDFTYVCLIYNLQVILGSVMSENINDDANTLF